MMNRISCMVLCFLFSASFDLIAQEGEKVNEDSLSITSSKGNFPKATIPSLDQFSISGYYRFVTNFRHLSQSYSHLTNQKNNIFVGDDSQIPQLMLNMSGSLNSKTSFGTDFYIWSPMTGSGQIENVKGLNLGISLYGNYSSTIGNFNVRAGGINWHALSPFTFQANRGYNRYSLFERNPWDPNTKKMDSRYQTFYEAGSIQQDLRWGQQAFQGLIVEGTDMPNNFSGSFMYGKTQLNGGISPIPNSSIGGRIKKTYKTNFVSFNTFNNTSYLDSTEQSKTGFNLATIEFEKHIKNNWKVSGELGTGKTFNDNVHTKWGEAISIKIAKKAGKFPFEFHMFRISPKVFNNSSVFINTSIDQDHFANSGQGSQPVLMAIASSMNAIGQLSNNRQGIELNSQLDFGRFKNSVGLGISSEIENLSAKITYAHPINAIALSHFWRWNFPSNVGPYGNLSKIYRNVYETLSITDLDLKGLPLFKKCFNTIEFNSKVNGRFLNKPYYLFYLGQFSTVQDFISPIPVFSTKSILRTYYHQLESFLVLHSNFIWCNYLGYERIIADYKTAVDVISKRPKNQYGYAIATGFDFKLSKGCGLYFRQRWMDYKDTSFEKDKYKGFETTLEIKIFF